MIQKKKNSSFDLARFFLDEHQREAMAELYAYCRQVDDAADEMPPAEGRQVLKQWKRRLPTSRLIGTYGLPQKPLAELIVGAQSDLRARVRFFDQKTLDLYCYRVAGVVGLACLPIFGVDLKAGREYARLQGRALQQINFIRDAAEDARRNRIYFVMNDLKRHGIAEKDWLRGSPGPGAAGLFLQVAKRARQDLADAWERRSSLAGSLRAADIMADVYTCLLDVMQADGFRVFEKRYTVPGWKKVWLVLRRSWRVGP